MLPTKLECFVEGEWQAHSFPSIFRMPGDEETSKRVMAGVPQGDPGVFTALVACLTPPFFLLYVLHTPRGEALPGRYQSPLLSLAQVEAFIDEFAAYLRADARFDLWAYSPEERATLVWDRHDVMYGYGPLDRYASRLQELGFSSGVPAIPSPHQHRYRQELDDLAKGVMEAFEWSFSPLSPGDEQSQSMSKSSDT